MVCDDVAGFKYPLPVSTPVPSRAHPRSFLGGVSDYANKITDTLAKGVTLYEIINYTDMLEPILINFYLIFM